MKFYCKVGRLGVASAVAGVLALSAMCTVQAQVSAYGDKQTGEQSGNELPTVLNGAKIEQHLDAQLPLLAPLTDDMGKQVTLGEYFADDKPAVLALVYYQCPMLCSEEMDGLTQALAMVHLDAGRDFKVIVLSIDASEGPVLAAKKKALYTRRYARPGREQGWHFLVGDKLAIDAMTEAVGFGYVKVPGPDGRLTQYAHASSIQIVTPRGRIAQYYLGVEYSPKDLLLGLVEASGNRIGSPVANILTYCYHYDPHRNRHSLIVARVVQLGGMITVAGLGGFMFVMFRRDVRLGRAHSLT